MTEEWRAIEGFRGIYEVSNQGQVRRVAGAYKTPRTRLVKCWPKGPKGHRAVALWINNQRTTLLVHRLVMAAFVGPCPLGMEVRHVDGVSTNNHLENLAYGTHSENELDKIRHGTHNNARKTHCKWGHEFTPENTIRTPKQRRCRTCTNATRRRAAA